MADRLEAIQNIAEEVRAHSARRKKVVRMLKQRGFKGIGRGAFIGVRTDDVVSGLSLTGSQIETSISSFILPVFDENSFVNLSLGRKLVTIESNVELDDDVSSAVNSFVAEISYVKMASDLLDYLHKIRSTAFYGLWAEYICLIRLRLYVEAESFFTEDRVSRLHFTVIDRLNQLQPFVRRRDFATIEAIFDKWSAASSEIFGIQNHNINVSSH